MKKYIFGATFLFIFLLSTSYSMDSCTHYEHWIEKFLNKTKFNKNYSENFVLEDMTASTTKHGYRIIKGHITNLNHKEFQWVKFRVSTGNNFEQMEDVHTLTLFNVEPEKTYSFNSKVYVGKIEGRKVKIEYLTGKTK